MSSRERQDARKKEYKKTVDIDLSRRKREETTTTLRKNTREDSIAKKRSLATSALQTPSTAQEILIPEHIQAQFLEFEKQPIEEKLKNLPNLTSALKSNDQALVYGSLVQFRKLLSLEKNPPIDSVIGCGVIPVFNELLKCTNVPKVQFEAAWALTNITSGNSHQTEAVIKSGTIPILIPLLSSPHEEVVEQATWALGNIAGDSVGTRDLLIEKGLVSLLVKVASTTNRGSLVQNATWTLSNLCRGKPHPPFEFISPCLDLITKILLTDNPHKANHEILSDILWTTSYLCDGENARIQSVVDTGIVPTLVELLSTEVQSIGTPALRTIGNIVTGESQQTQAVLDAGALEPLTALLLSKKKLIKKEACWAISNITAGTPEQIETAVMHDNTIPYLIALLNHSEREIKREACWALSNATNGSALVISRLVKHDIIGSFLHLLRNSENDSIIIKVILEGLLNILVAGQRIAAKSGVNPYAAIISEQEGEYDIQDLQQHKKKDIYEKANDIMQYFETDGSDSENNEPNQSFPAFQLSTNSNFHIDI
eukprot:gene2538-3141_t